jgi:cytochrome c-type biogenesis protein
MDVTGILAFSAGLLSFFSPCVLPLVPSYMIYISGAAVDNYSDLSHPTTRRAVLLHCITFILGFSLVFVALGLSSSFLGALFSTYQTWIMRVGGILLILMGLNSLGVLKIPFLNQEKAVHLKTKPLGFLGSFLIGVTFSLGWTPCIGPVLASILLVASTSTAFTGVYLLSLYSLGLAIPFFIAGLLVNRLMGFLKRYGHVLQHTAKVIGVLLIVVGLLLLTGYWATISAKLS